MRRFMRGILLLLLLLLTVSCRASESDPCVRFHFLDVGQGDALLIRTPDGDILVDASDESAQALLCLRLEQLGVTSLRLAVFTHADEDHIGGADGVLSQFPADEIWISAAPMENEAARLLLQTAETSGSTVTIVRSGHLLLVGKLALAVFAPIGDVSNGGNESSIVLRLQYGETTALLMGDADIAVEEALITRYGVTQLSCDLLKVGHHGSNTSTSPRFLRVTRPTYAVISCGAGNSYGHPTGEVLQKLRDERVEVLRTDLCGEIVFETDGKTLRCVSVP